jgi:hypothetical protein
MSLDVAQQVGTKNDGHNSKIKQPATHAIVIVYFPNFSSCSYFFYFFNFFIFSTIFYIFVQTENTRDGSIKSFSPNRIKMRSTENQARSLKSVQQLWSLRSPT